MYCHAYTHTHGFSGLWTLIAALALLLLPLVPYGFNNCYKYPPQLIIISIIVLSPKKISGLVQIFSDLTFFFKILLGKCLRVQINSQIA